MTDSTTTTDHAAAIRASYKALGWTSRDVSVRADYYANGSSIDIRIKSLKPDLATVKKIAEDHESIRHDHTGEILSGGNRYVSATYASEVLDQLAAPFVDPVTRALQEAAVRALAGDLNSLSSVAGTVYSVGHDSRTSGYTLWGDEAFCLGSFWNADEVARAIGVRSHATR